jgi:hypothetical protein
MSHLQSHEFFPFEEHYDCGDAIEVMVDSYVLFIIYIDFYRRKLA